MAVVSVREFIEAAIYYTGLTCTKEVDGEMCNGKLQQVWITIGEADEDPILNYIECSVCNTEYAIIIAFVEEGILKNRDE